MTSFEPPGGSKHLLDKNIARRQHDLITSDGFMLGSVQKKHCSRLMLIYKAGVSM